jgi:hypothetical protein
LHASDAVSQSDQQMTASVMNKCMNAAATLQMPSGIHICLHHSQGFYVSCCSNGLQALASYKEIMLHGTPLNAVQGLALIQPKPLQVPNDTLPHSCSAQTLVGLQHLLGGMQRAEQIPAQGST